MIKKYFITMLLLLSLLLNGCIGQSIEKPEQILKLIDETVKITEKAANEKDIKLAREIWTQISEYGVKAIELGNDDLANSLGKLASTYVYLVSYIETEDNSQLLYFRDCFEQAVGNLRESVSSQQDR